MTILKLDNSVKMWRSLALALMCLVAVDTFSGDRLRLAYRNARRQMATSIEFSLNDFAGEFRALSGDFDRPIKSASIEFSSPSSNTVVITEQRDLVSHWREFELGRVVGDAEPTSASGDGIKQKFRFADAEFILATVRTTGQDCYAASLINLSIREEVFRTPCLSMTSDFDFNGIGGGYAEKDSRLLLALGAPESTDKTIRRLAGAEDSPYGKILAFDADRLGRRPVDKYAYEVYASGFRNPQGLLNVDGDIYAIEQGPQGGDELNLIEEGGDYGWPTYSFGSPYGDEQPRVPFLVPGASGSTRLPLYAFVPSVALSDIRKCPAPVSQRYLPMRCVVLSSLNAKSLFFALIDSDTQVVTSIESVWLGMRIREFATNAGDRLVFSVEDAGLSKGVYEVIIR